MKSCSTEVVRRGLFVSARQLCTYLRLSCTMTVYRVHLHDRVCAMWCATIKYDTRGGTARYGRMYVYMPVARVLHIASTRRCTQRCAGLAGMDEAERRVQTNGGTQRKVKAPKPKADALLDQSSPTSDRIHSIVSPYSWPCNTAWSCFVSASDRIRGMAEMRACCDGFE